MPNMVTTKVGSHVDLIQFAPDVSIPIGFLASMRKKHHSPCAKGGGFVEKPIPGHGMAKVVCMCAVNRAQKKMKQVGVSHFVTLGQEWRDRELERVAASEAACEEEGSQAAEGAENPYPAMTDQHLAWRKGYDRRGFKTSDVPEAPKAETAKTAEKGGGDAYANGFYAGENGDSETSNPHPVGTDEHLSWNDGFAKGAGEEKT